MNSIYNKKNCLFTAILACLILFSACEERLKENPLDFIDPENLFATENGAEAALVQLYANGRGFHSSWNDLNEKAWQITYGQGADIGYHVDKKSYVSDYTMVIPTDGIVTSLWNKCYDVIKDANYIIYATDNSDIAWSSEGMKLQKNAEARFFRAFAYRMLVWCWGDVPLILEPSRSPNFGFTRAAKADVLAQILVDLELATENLPQKNDNGARLTKAAADYLLAETYCGLKRWDDAIAATDRVINDPQYALMTERFGSMTNKPGDVYWDLFRLKNQDRTSGNKENIFAWQYDYETAELGGGTYNATERAWGPFLEKLRAVSAQDTTKMVRAVLNIGRPVCFIKTTDWVENGMWNDFENDIRNSPYNVKREFIINNPLALNYGKPVSPSAGDLYRNHYAYYQKFTHADAESYPQGPNDSQGRIWNDWYVFRVAGIYLLKAEALLGKGDQAGAAAAINVVRARAKAAPVSPAEVTIDYILDERTRELLGEEYRRITLCRVGKLVERTKLHNPVSGPTMKDYHELFPIPQQFIDDNKDAVIEQNPGY